MSFNIASAIDSVLVVDDKFEEVQQLIDELAKKSIQVAYINPEDIDHVDVKCGNTLIVLDFELIESVGHKQNINKIRDVLSKITVNLKVYGIAFWSKHSEEAFDDDGTKKLFDVLKSDIDKDIKDKSLVNPPLYYVSIVDKLQYMDCTHEWSAFFDNFKTSLETSKTAMYYFRWSYLMKEAVYDTFWKMNNILSMYSYADKEKVFAFLIHHLASAQLDYKEDNEEKLANFSFRAMAGLLEDTVKEKSDSIENCKVLENFHTDMIVSNINGDEVRFKTGGNGQIETSPGTDVPKTIGQLNTLYAFDFGSEYAKGKYLPGNIYDQATDFLSKLDEKFNDQRKILFEITPPCDYAQGNCQVPKFLEGALCTLEKGKSIKSSSKENFYTYLNPVTIDSESYHLILDFNIIHVGIISSMEENYICRAKNGLFADILQKYSSHISRLGVNFINKIKFS